MASWDSDSHALRLSRRQRAEDYAVLHHAQVDSGDYDPIYPMLREVCRLEGAGPERVLWTVLCHTIWYHPEATLRAVDLCPSVTCLPKSAEALEDSGLLDLPTGPERRIFRSRRNLIWHLLSLRHAMPDGVSPWLDSRVSGTAEEAWKRVGAAYEALPCNGRYFSYKFAEMIQKVAGRDLRAPDANHRHSTGPRHGLQLIEAGVPSDRDNKAGDVARLEAQTARWAKFLREPDVAIVETTLCAFSTLVGGNNYHGRDTDYQLGVVVDAEESGRLPPGAAERFYRARGNVFPDRMLGERHGWSGIRKPLLRLYRDEGVLEV